MAVALPQRGEVGCGAGRSRGPPAPALRVKAAAALRDGAPAAPPAAWPVRPQVNARLARVEAQHGKSFTGDPGWPKEQWPPREVCAACVAAQPGAAAAGEGGGGSGGGWHEAAVAAFLERSYGPASYAAVAQAAGLAPAALGGGGGGSRSQQLELGLSPPATTAGWAGWATGLALPFAGVALAAVVCAAVLRRARGGGGARPLRRIPLSGPGRAGGAWGSNVGAAGLGGAK